MGKYLSKNVHTQTNLNDDLLFHLTISLCEVKIKSTIIHHPFDENFWGDSNLHQMLETLDNHIFFILCRIRFFYVGLT